MGVGLFLGTEKESAMTPRVLSGSGTFFCLCDVERCFGHGDRENTFVPQAVWLGFEDNFHGVSNR
jgi:hypothetical protein